MSPAAAAIVRALMSRAGADRDRILLTDVESVDWQSLTFIGERHRVIMRVTGPRAQDVTDRLTAGIDEAEFHVPGHIVADVVLVGEAVHDADGSVSVEFEALTIAE